MLVWCLPSNLRNAFNRTKQRLTFLKAPANDSLEIFLQAQKEASQ